MNNINEQLRNMTVTYVNKLHDILSVILDKYVEVFNAEMQFNPEGPAFVSELGEYRIILTRDLNGLFIKVNVVNQNNETVADCGLNVEGKFTETFTRMAAEPKKILTTWFDAISEIDINNIVLSNDEAAAQPEVEVVENNPDPVKE
jgi:hypothetical protein